jgi:hypothetical protein
MSEINILEIFLDSKVHLSDSENGVKTCKNRNDYKFQEVEC